MALGIKFRIASGKKPEFASVFGVSLLHTMIVRVAHGPGHAVVFRCGRKAAPSKNMAKYGSPAVNAML